jgi:glycosyltransferase involved in cell wall biosynthesis
MNKRKKLLICYVEPHEYRMPIWRKLSEVYDLTLIHGGSTARCMSERINEIPCAPIKIWRFKFQLRLLREIYKNNYDAIIFFCDISWLTTVLGFFLARNCHRKIVWGFWRTTNNLANFLRIYIARKADASVFYASSAARDFCRSGVDSSRIWIARNTVKVEPSEFKNDAKRNAFLFLGTFNYRKRNDIAIKAFNEACAHIPEDIILILVGDGEHKEECILLANSLPCRNRIFFCPGTHDGSVIKKYYEKSIASVSFGQAGLSVLQSLGHGVPFLCSRDAISGGEIENIHDGVNGRLCAPNQDALAQSFIKLSLDSPYATKLGHAAIEYYREFCTLDAMVDGFIGAIENTHENCEIVNV